MFPAAIAPMIVANRPVKPGIAVYPYHPPASAPPGDGHHPGHGLIGIRERVRLYDGEMTTSAPAGGGFLLRVRLPLNGRPQ